MSLRKIRRREFIAAVLAVAAGKGLSDPPDRILLAAAKGTDTAGSVRASIGALGGIGRFVKPGQRVMLLPNPQGRQRGASTNPELVEEVVRLCLGAGAAKVQVCSIHSSFRWRPTGIDKAAIRAGAEFWTPGSGGDWRTVKVKGARRQKEVRVIAPVLASDVVINMPIAKQHGSTRFTGTLKNLMGVNDGNMGWHRGTAYLVDSIVDLASVVHAHLCVVDSTEVLAENGPFGPGRTIKPYTVIAGIDHVAVDAHACTLLGMKPENVSTIAQAAERGLGTMRIEEAASDGTVKKFRASA